MTEEFKKVLNLVKRSGDKLVLFDTASDTAFMLLPLSEYEKTLAGGSSVRGLTEEELLAKINRDISTWRETQKLEQVSDNNNEMSMPEAMSKLSDLNDSKIEEMPPVETYQFEPVEELVLPAQAGEPEKN